MKNLEKKSIEKLNNCQINTLDSLKGGSSGKHTVTAKNSTSEGLFDKDKNDECNCEEVTK